MRKEILTSLIVIGSVILLAPHLYGEEQHITGNHFRQMSPAMRLAYIEGFREGLQFAILHPREAARAHTCTSVKMTNDQMLEIVSRDIESRPNQWHFPLVVLTAAAIV